ncbi:MAG TPA: hypothetical protein P5186_21185 [Candidatus Paceibacterota bacterium]|nr:hypothetical protein [Candidatus Paceibacterota bacterium]HRZ58007.1 hypothetical protein [Candidatus Paceibacterota bacterium]
MHRDFKIKRGIYLVQPPHELDIHNFYDFQELRYSVAERTCSFLWRRSKRNGVPASLPASATIEFRGVTEFRFRPREPKMPFSEDDCVRNFGYWTDENWAEDSVMICNDPQTSHTECLNAIDFMSGALVIVQADSAHATIVP